MRAFLAAAVLLLANASAGAADRWVFASRLAVGAEPVAGVFHHLDGAGRKHIAVADGSVAITWEDNRNSSPQVYLALMPAGQRVFDPPVRVSTGAEAYEPAIVSLPHGRFVLAWEQDSGIRARLLLNHKLMPVRTLAGSGASHVSLATHGDRIFAAWREQRERRWYLRVAAMHATADGTLEIDRETPVETNGVEAQMQFPSLAANAAGLCIAWEDRRAGHTRLLVSHSGDEARSFAEPQHLNEFFSNRNQYDQGNGVTRVALAAFAQDEILAAWMDKRRGGLGYGIFAALGSDGCGIFGPNEKVHGEQGDKQPHYNPATAGNAAGDFVVAWDDFRNGDSDIWLSSYDEDDEWSQDYAPAVASGAGEQSHAAIVFDDRGYLHLLWLERADVDAPSRLWYSRGSPRQAAAAQ